jgi:hypothetical protein
MHSTPNSWLVARLQAIADGAGPIRHATTRAEAESVLRRLRPSLADSAVRLAHVGRELPLYFDGLAARDGDVDDSLMPARIALSTAAGKGVAASFSASLSPLCESQVATLGLPAPMAAQLNKMHARVIGEGRTRWHRRQGARAQGQRRQGARARGQRQQRGQHCGPGGQQPADSRH